MAKSFKTKFLPPILVVLSFGLAALQLHRQGRGWWCNCRAFVWTSDAWGSLTSQTFLDPYSFTHVLHGFLFFWLIAWLLGRRLNDSWQLSLAIAVESFWEVFENTNFIIDRYRSQTAALGYNGDTVINSFGDILCCLIGFIIARRLGWRRSFIAFGLLELLLIVWIKDSLLLEILMLVFPIDAIRAWQMCG